MKPLRIVPVDECLRERCLALAVRPDQRRFVAPVEHYLADAEWSPFAIVEDGEPVGFVMTGFDAGEPSTWIGGLIVDARHQGRGIGLRTLQILTVLHQGPLALSYHPDNEAARQLYASAGFAETGELTPDGEVVARRP